MNSKPGSQDTKYAILGLVSGIVTSPIAFGISWSIVEEVSKLLKLPICAYLHRINNGNSMVFALPLLLFIGSAAGGVCGGHLTLAKSNKTGLALCAAIPGAFAGTLLAGLLFVVIEFGRQCKGFPF